VALEREVDRDARVPLIGRRAQLVDAADGVDRLLDALGDRGLDLFGARARQVGLHRYDRGVGFRHEIEAERFVRHGAQHDERRGHHDGEDRPLDADFGDVHGRAPRPPGSSAILTVTPVASWLRFVVASCSSPFKPVVTSTSLFCRAPSEICCWRAFPSSITYTVDTPARVEIASSGTASTRASTWVSTTPCAKKP